MRFFLDNDVPDRVGDLLNEAGFEVTKLREMLPVTTDDPEVFEYTKSSGMILITCNRDDFLPLASTMPHPGIIILIRRDNRLLEGSRVLHLIERAGEQGLRNNINFA
jgi:predicted nuclease of predicted toxin-antitoxin system